jgi:hypothetical protein
MKKVKIATEKLDEARHDEICEGVGGSGAEEEIHVGQNLLRLQESENMEDTQSNWPKLPDFLSKQ